MNNCQDHQLVRYRKWFYAAALYNLVWGSINVLFPYLLFDLLGMVRPAYLALWQVVGMFVLVYAPDIGGPHGTPASIVISF